MTKHTLRDPSNKLLYDPPDTLRHGRIRDVHYTSSVMSSSTSSASKTATYCSIGGPGPPTFYDQVNTIQSYHSGSASRSKTLPRNTTTTLYDDRSSSSASANRTVYYNRPTTMVSIGGGNATIERRPTSANSNLSTEGIVYPCGGHCRTFERCFHYFLQFFFVIGILAGMSLVLASFRLHYTRQSDDQSVLIYIGVVIALVCTLLLSIQCSIEREVKRKKRKRRIAVLLAKNNRSRVQLPLRTIEPDRNTYTEMAVVAAPLTHPAAPAPMTTFCQMPLIAQDYHYSTQNSISNEDMERSQNGVPWWRRQEERRIVNNENVVQL
ncbi:uncharacterized protein LOC135837582 [Planococcus citri]|uniref:uncharacterized protein LOC135837582 n=1 Tax=Planococcus citri TaxID=170843 RepID=UPI0031F75545